MKKRPKHEIVYRPVDSLEPDPRNSNTHPPEQIEQLRKSVNKYGITRPLMLKADEKTIGAGNGVWEAAKLEGVKEVPTITLHLTDEEWRAYAILDNRIPRNSVWNVDVLAAELTALHDMGFNLGDMGFGDLELGTLGIEGFSLPERTAEAEITPEPVQNPAVKRGELWILGPHRLMIGDSTDPKVVAHLFAGATPVLMATDPPYGVNYDPSWRAKAGINKNKAKMGKVSNDDRADWTPSWNNFPGDVAYVWHGGLHSSTVEASLRAAGFGIRSQIIWAKDRFALGRGDYHWRHEPAWYAVREGKKGNWASDRKQDTVWNIAARDDSGHGHGTQKPIECMRRPIINNTKRGDGVYDPFCGSGTTLIAAHMEKRRCFAMELDEIYAQVIIERWQSFSGEAALLDGDGRTFEVIRAERESGAGRKKRTGVLASSEKSVSRKKRKPAKPPAAS